MTLLDFTLISIILTQVTALIFAYIENSKLKTGK